MARFFLFLFMISASSAWADSGIQGRTAWRGDLVSGVRVRAYRHIEDIATDKVLAVSDPTGSDGIYTLDLPPGAYVLTARNYETTARPGDYFCYYSGSPVSVSEGYFSNVGFNLIKIPQEVSPVAGKSSGIKGEISYLDAPLERVYLYVYKDAKEGFKGPGYNIVPVEKGQFKLRLPPGDYYLLARKRARGGRFGPVETGDYFSYYYGNPVHIEAGQIRETRIEAITRLSLFDDTDNPVFIGIQGDVVGPDGTPLSGLYVFGYRKSSMSGVPEVFSARTDKDGRFRLPLTESGAWYLLARENFGGPAVEGELYGRFGGENIQPVRFAKDKSTPKVTIHVAPKKNL